MNKKIQICITVSICKLYVGSHYLKLYDENLPPSLSNILYSFNISDLEEIMMLEKNRVLYSMNCTDQNVEVYSTIRSQNIEGRKFRALRLKVGISELHNEDRN